MTRPKYDLILTHTVGGLVGGVSIGVVLMLLAGVANDLPIWLRAGTVFAIAALAASVDGGLLRLPSRQIQVTRGWMSRFGGHRAFFLYGGVLGMGVMTSIPWGATYAVFSAGAFLGSAEIAIVVGLSFGVARTLTAGIGTLKPDHASRVLYRSFRARRIARAASLSVIVVTASIAVVESGVVSSAKGANGMEVSQHREIRYGGLKLSLPIGWSGRVLFLDYRGREFMLQTANFTLPTQRGFSPPPELPAGQDDRLKSMKGDDVLVSVIPAGTTGEVSPDRSVTRNGLRTSGRVLKGMSMGVARRRIAGRLLDIEVTFGTARPSGANIESANTVIDSISGS